MSNANQLEIGLLALINAERADAGLSPLRLITVLNDAAESHSAWMLQTETFSHTGAGGTSPSERMADAGYPFEGRTVALENIGWQSERGPDGAADDVAQIHDGLMASDGHRANILNPDVTDIGIGVETGTFSTPGGDFEAVMVTQVFGRTDGDVSGMIDPGTGAADPADDVVDDPVADDTPPTDDGTGPDTPAPDTPDTPADDTPAGDPSPDDPTGDMDQPDLVADADDNGQDDQDTDTPDQTDTGDGDQTGDDDSPDTDPGVPTMADMPLPCGLDMFHVDLSSAFDVRKEGDQWIWETSEDRLVDAFLASFNDWADGDTSPGYDVDIMADDADIDADLADILPVKDGMDAPGQMSPETDDDGENEDDWLMESCV